MPARSNLFQRVVYLIQGHLADGSTVTESAMLEDRITGTPREVDVLVTGAIANRRVAIGIECRDHKRRQSVGWVEEMYSKHLRLPTDALLLVSASGFTAEANRVAYIHGIELLEPGIAEDHAARSTVGRAKSLWYKQADFTATKVTIDLESDDGTVVDTAFEAAVVPTFFDAAGHEIGGLFSVAEQILRGIDPREAMRDATGTENEFNLHVGHPTVTSEAGEVKQLYLRTTSAAGEVLCAVRALTIVGNAEIVVAEVPLTHGDLGGTPYAFGQTPLPGRDLLLVLTEPTDDERKLTFQFTPRKETS